MMMFQEYKNIMDRCNLNYKIVKADTGAMGGSLSEEFQAITEIGEDVVVTCEGAAQACAGRKDCGSEPAGGRAYAHHRTGYDG